MTHTHFVGSVNLPDSEAVFRSARSAGAGILPRIPDGETDRPFFMWMLPAILSCPGIVETGERTLGGLLPKVSVKPESAADLDLGELGIARAASNSYRVFAGLKADGVIEAGTRFQVSIPSPLTMATAIVDAADQEVMYEAFMRAVSEEVARAAAAIPQDELAIQFDMPGEMIILEGFLRPWFDTDDMSVFADQAHRLCDMVADEIELGFHLCYGSAPPPEGGRPRHWLEPKDAGVLVKLTNEIAAAATRRVDWVHVPVPIERDDEEFFRPLGALQLPPETELFLGLVHDIDGQEGAMRRAASARKSRREFGVSTECGLGRVPSEDVPGLMELQTQVAAAMSVTSEGDAPRSPR